MKGQPKGKGEMHRFQVATGVKQNGKRRSMEGDLCRIPLNTRKEYRNAVAGDHVRQE